MGLIGSLKKKIQKKLKERLHDNDTIPNIEKYLEGIVPGQSMTATLTDMLEKLLITKGVPKELSEAVLYGFIASVQDIDLFKKTNHEIALAIVEFAEEMIDRAF